MNISNRARAEKVFIAKNKEVFKENEARYKELLLKGETYEKFYKEEKAKKKTLRRSF